MKKEAAQRQANECMQQMTARTQQMTARAGQQEAEAGGGSAGAGVKLAAKSPPTPPAIKSKTSPQKKRISFVDEGDEAAAAALEA